MIETAFAKADTENSGQLSPSTTIKLLQECGFDSNLAQISKMMRLVDDNFDDQISLDELKRLVICLTLSETNKNSEKSFYLILYVIADTDCSGKISKEEFIGVCEKLDLL